MPETAPRILVVDDREENRYICARILRSGGYAVVEARSGREALQKVLEDPALVILDVRLPDIVGYEVCRRIKDNPRTAHIPVLQISAAFMSSESRVQALESGADAYLTQPIEPTVLIATVRALLRLRDAEALSRLSAKQWQSTFDALREGIALLDNNWNVVRCNRALKELFESTYAEIEQQNVLSLLRQHLGLELATEEIAPFLRETQQGRRWFSTQVEVIRENDAVRGGILIVSEITDRKQAEDALRSNERLAAMGRLLNSIAHEINNPLEAVTNLLYLMQSSAADPQMAEYVSMASSEMARISRITKQTLTFSRESSEPVEIALPEILDSVVTLYAPQFNQKDIRVVRRYESPDLLVGFPGELRQVFSNLLRNALEALPVNGQLTIHAYGSRNWRDLSQRGVRISICDSGSGIPPEIRSSVFEPFFTTKELKGSGLGLWLTAGIVAKHHGHIGVRSSIAPGQSGTCFSIFLPTQRVAKPRRVITKKNAVA
ncbi:MAG TPA: response regulator [Terriglobales bacterium]|nr:response regulator [Terriglobales bacterium]